MDCIYNWVEVIKLFLFMLDLNNDIEYRCCELSVNKGKCDIALLHKPNFNIIQLFHRDAHDAEPP